MTNILGVACKKGQNVTSKLEGWVSDVKTDRSCFIYYSLIFPLMKATTPTVALHG